ncbi:formylglycine-generating enzyme family protein [Kordiimonas aestuarii]|uniref:formylglycine-generating enzyme family protein n=1 Tax=Kordiimonas aestuarii TaxID=1005925 RepID=UPI0021D3C9F3|nr:formylglycine-generating enzyme family protein [Kordiimonas aestuarii]
MIRYIALITLSFILIAMADPAEMDMSSRDAAPTLEAAIEAIDAGRFRLADEILTSLLEENPHNQEYYYLAARAAYGSGQYRRAKDLIERYLSFHGMGYAADEAVKLKASIEEALRAFSASEKAAFDYAQRQHTIFAYAAYRDAYPASANVEQADFLSYRRAKEVNVEISYLRYLNYWPEGKFKADAERSADLAAFREARQQNTVESYQGYQTAYPRGAYVLQASDREQTLGYSRATADGSVAALQAYLARYPMGSYRGEAQKALNAAKTRAPLRALSGPTVNIPPGFFIYRPQAQPGKQAAPKTFELTAPFTAMAFEVTFDMWDACVRDGACSTEGPRDEGWGRVGRPVINVTRADVATYTAWLNKSWQAAGGTGRWRLPSEVEWAYMARGRNSQITAQKAAFDKASQNCLDCDDRLGADATFPVGRAAPNSFRLYDMLGNVAEWVDDCWGPEFGAAPLVENCQSGVIRGATNLTVPMLLAMQARQEMAFDARHKFVGFRLIKVD